MSIALYGGSFDPIHIGHLITASQATYHFSLDKVIFIPTHTTPLKNNKLLATNKDRYNMVKLSIVNNKKLEVSDFEIKKEGLSYSYYTVKHFKEMYKNKKIYFIVGTDRAKDLKKWYNIDELVKMVTFIFVSRDKENLESIVNSDIFYQNVDYKIMESPIIEISSSLIRNNIKQNKNIDYMITRECKSYIEELNLYEFSRNSK